MKPAALVVPETLRTSPKGMSPSTAVKMWISEVAKMRLLSDTSNLKYD